MSYTIGPETLREDSFGPVLATQKLDELLRAPSHEGKVTVIAYYRPGLDVDFHQVLLERHGEHGLAGSTFSIEAESWAWNGTSYRGGGRDFMDLWGQHLRLAQEEGQYAYEMYVTLGVPVSSDDGDASVSVPEAAPSLADALGGGGVSGGGDNRISIDHDGEDSESKDPDALPGLGETQDRPQSYRTAVRKAGGPWQTTTHASVGPSAPPTSASATSSRSPRRSPLPSPLPPSSSSSSPVNPTTPTQEEEEEEEDPYGNKDDTSFERDAEVVAKQAEAMAKPKQQVDAAPPGGRIGGGMSCVLCFNVCSVYTACVRVLPLEEAIIIPNLPATTSRPNNPHTPSLPSTTHKWWTASPYHLNTINTTQKRRTPTKR